MRKNVEKLAAIGLSVAMAASLTACGSGSTTATTAAPETTAETTAAETEAETAAETEAETEAAEDDGVWSPVDAEGNTKRDERDAVSENGMVASSNVYATMAGLEVLEAGGNAVDAAVAVAYALGVAEPFTSGLGGGGFMLIHTADGQNKFIDYREVAPAAQDAYSWLDDKGELVAPEASIIGGLSVAVPGEVAGMEYALQNYGSGSLTRKEVMQPAIDLAKNGYKVSATMYGAISDQYAYMLEYPEGGEYYLNEGLAYQIGDTIISEDLAKSLEMIAEGGADAFYKGEMAQAMVDVVQKYDGLLTMEDLANYEVKEREPVTSTYRGYQVISAPPASSGGTHLIEILNVLENYDIGSMEVNSAEYCHVLSEAFKAAFADRAAYMADTDFADNVPLAGLTDKEYAKTIFDRITEESQEWSAGNPSDYGHGSTTSFSVADKEGNMVAVTQTINHFFGSMVAVPGYGFFMNDEMDDFSQNPESVNCVEGGKRPLSSMSPTVVLKEDGSSFMTVGSPGATRIFPTVVQVISHIIDHGMDIQTAIDTCRIYDNGTADGICYESDGVTPVTPETIAELEAMGHAVTDKGAWQLFFGGVQGVVYQEDGTLHGGADPRRDGKALGF